jgi:DNA-binding LacI/PurR family transcriptional regulator
MLPEIDHLMPEFSLRYVIRPMDGDVSVDHFVERYNTVWSREHMRPRLSKYRSMTMDDLARRLVLTNDFTEIFADVVPPVAWVFEQERNAALALDWCRERRMQVPRQVSIVGLENRREYADRGITACVRDWETMGYLMAHALIGDIPLQRTRRGFIAYGALLLERETTAA